MDTLTHALSGVLAAQVAYRPIDPRTDRARLIAVGLAGAFPDLDFALILVDPLTFLNLHRGPTHSLLLLPLWAGVLALPLGRILALPWRLCAASCALGLFAHIMGDWVTLYGTRLFYPISDHAYSLDISFDVNPWIAAVALTGSVASVTWHRRSTAAATLAVIAVLLTGQAVLRQGAREVATAQAARWGLDRSAVRVLPQPLSPFHWGLVVADTHGYWLAYLNLAPAPTLAPLAGLGWLGEMAAAYRPAAELKWAHYQGVDANALARRAWGDARLAPFRQFAQFPVLLSIDRANPVSCVWFTDLRHVLPLLPPSFRYGLCCRANGKECRPYRLRYLTEDGRQAI